MPGRVVRAVLSGSFRKDQTGLRSAYDELVTCGCQVLSPHQPDFEEGDVLFVRHQAEKDFSPYELERHHLLGIDQADFLWVHAPEGYVGTSTAFEIGYATARGIPVYAAQPLSEPGLAAFVTTVPSVYRALTSLSAPSPV